MSKTLVLIFHPHLARSRANAALFAAIKDIPGVEVVDMQQAYPDGAIDVDMEVKRLLAADRIVLQFPLQWYSIPALLRTWQDTVLTRMYYLSYAQEGRQLEGKPLLVAVTAGNRPEAYSSEGVNLFPLEVLLQPLQAMANRCGLPWSTPYLVYSANQLDNEALAANGKQYARRIQRWIDAATDTVSEDT
jgi:putative NADPH-quinone reductase